MTINTSNLAFIFPGQGSQSVTMLADLAGNFPLVRDTFDEASAVLGYDLWQLVQDGPDTELNQTHRTQPAMLAAGVAVYRIWQEKNGVTPAYMAGHSLGEYTALVCSGALDFKTAISLVAARGQFMQAAVPEGIGAMAAILGLDDAAVIAVCDEAAQGEVVSAVNFNSVGQVVVAGNKAAVERAIDLAKSAGAKRALLLPVSVPSHCSLMQPAAAEMRILLQNTELSAPDIPVLNNVDVAAESTPDAIRDALVRQLTSPVRWVDIIQSLASQGVDHVVECGPGKVLAGLNKRIERSMVALPVFDTASFEKAMAATGVSIGALENES